MPHDDDHFDEGRIMKQQTTKKSGPKRSRKGAAERALELFKRSEAAENAATALEVMRLSGSGRRARVKRRFRLALLGGYVRYENEPAVGA